MKADNLPVCRRENIVVQEIDSELMIYDLDKNKAFCLNETSAIVWQLCDGKKSFLQISEELSKRLNSPTNEELVWLAIDQLQKEGLVKVANFETKFKGLSRREIIRKVGLSSMVALPLVSSLIAPNALNAASGPVNNCGMGATTIFNPCTMNSDCGIFNQPPAFPLCCRLAAFGARVCIIQSTAGAQCDCTQA